MLLGGCQGLNERLSLAPHSALSGDDAPNDGGANGSNGRGALTRSFELAYAIAAYDQEKIDEGVATPPAGAGAGRPPSFSLVWPPAGSPQMFPSVTPTDVSYSPAARIDSDPCNNPTDGSANTTTTGQTTTSQAGGTPPPRQGSTATSGGLQAPSKPQPSQSDLIAAAKQQQAISGSGCSYQSVHARQLALAGFALADSNCRDFFDSKGNVQTGSTFITDVVSGGASIGGAVIGLVTGAAAVPAAVGSVTGISSQAQSLTNKDFLFGQDNIDDVRAFVFNALNQHTAAVLPEPDISDWTFAQAVAAVREHVAICFPPKILTLIKQAVSKATIQATTPDGTVTTGCTSAGVATPPKTTATTTQRPTIHSATVSVASNPNCVP